MKGNVFKSAYIVRYENPKGKNRILDLKKILKPLGVTRPVELRYNILGNENIEQGIEENFQGMLTEFDEIILDITALTKFLILVFLCKLENFPGTVRIIYSEAKHYAPTEKEYNSTKDKIKKAMRFPSRGFGTILRAKCLSSIRMQGQPVTLVAFTSFNEQLVRHMLGTISPHLLIFINGKPPRAEFNWREIATVSLHAKLMKEYPLENEFDNNERLLRTVSTLDYRETIEVITKIHKKYLLEERIIVAATGSKMQTVGLFFCKKMFSDIHIEYPTPDSYYIKGFSAGIRDIYELKIKEFSTFVHHLTY